MSMKEMRRRKFKIKNNIFVFKTTLSMTKRFIDAKTPIAFFRWEPSRYETFPNAHTEGSIRYITTRNL